MSACGYALHSDFPQLSDSIVEAPFKIRNRIFNLRTVDILHYYTLYSAWIFVRKLQQYENGPARSYVSEGYVSEI